MALLTKRFAQLSRIFGWVLAAAAILAVGAYATSFLFNPMVGEAFVKPGGSFTDYYTLFSEKKATYSIKVSQEWPRTEKDRPNPYPVAEWFNLSKTTISVEAGATTKIAFTVTGRKDAEGEVAARLEVIPLGGKDSPMTLSLGFSPVLYVTFAGTEKVKAMATGFKWGYLKEPGKIRFIWDLTNQGNVHVRPRAELFIQRAGSQEQPKKFDLPIGMITFPGETQTYSMDIKQDDVQNPGDKFNVTLKIFYGEVYGKKDLIITKTRRGRLIP